MFGTDWEEQIVYEGGAGGWGAGLAQGGIVDSIYGDWYAILFQDHGAIGRIPSIVAVEWQDGWPIMGTYDDSGKFNPSKADSSMKIRLNDSGLDNYYCGDDDFSYAEGEKLKLAWQWNHNPDNQNWSLSSNPGHYTITNGRTSNNVWRARNSLTQRTYGPKCVSETMILTENMKPGDYAGLVAVGSDYGMVGVRCDEDGNRYIFQGGAGFDTALTVHASASQVTGNTPVYLKVEYDFSYSNGGNAVDKANFYYSLDGDNWTSIGKQLSMSFSTSTTFMGARTWLSNYATTEAGGSVDFDYYKIYDGK